MSLEAITKICGVEDEMDQARAQARVQAQKILADAERSGQELLEQGRSSSAEKTTGVMKAAEERGEQRRREIKRPDHPAPGVLKAYRDGVGGAQDGALWLFS